MEPVIELKYALDTFYFLVMGAFVMLMAFSLELNCYFEIDLALQELAKNSINSTKESAT